MNIDNSVRDTHDQEIKNIIYIGKYKFNIIKSIKISINIKLYIYIFLVIISLILTQFFSGIFWSVIEIVIVTLSLILNLKLLFNWRLGYCYDIFFRELKIKIPFIDEKFDLRNKGNLIKINKNDIKELIFQINKKISYFHDQLLSINLMDYFVRSFIYITIFSLIITILSFATYYIVIDKIMDNPLGINNSSNFFNYIYLSVSTISTSGGTNPTTFLPQLIVSLEIFLGIIILTISIVNFSLLIGNDKISINKKIVGKLYDINDYIINFNWYILFTEGIKEFKKLNYKNASHFFNLVITLKPNDINAYKNLALTYSNLSENEKAILSLKTAIKIKPEDIDLKKTLGIAYYQANQFEKAIKIFQKVAEITQSEIPETDTYALAIQHIAFSYDQLDKSEKAIEAYQKALEVFPDNTDLIYNLGRLYYMQENYEKAIEKFKQIADSNPQDYDAIYNTAMSYLRAEKNEEAIPYFKKAIKIKPDSYDAWNNLGVVYIRANIPEKAVKAFNKADQLKKNL